MPNAPGSAAIEPGTLTCRIRDPPPRSRSLSWPARGGRTTGVAGGKPPVRRCGSVCTFLHTGRYWCVSCLQSGSQAIRRVSQAASVRRTGLSRFRGGLTHNRAIPARRRHLPAGRRVHSRDVHPVRQRQAVGAVESRPGGGRGDAGARRFLWRGLPGRAARPYGQRDRHCGKRDPAGAQRADGPSAPQAARDVGPLHLAHAGAQHPNRRGPDRPALQLERETTGANAVAARALREAGQRLRGPSRRSRRKRSPR